MASSTACVFCSIVRGEVDATIVARTPSTVAFLDTHPVFKGHVLVVPHDHHETLKDLPADVLPAFFAAVQRIAQAVEAGLGAHGTFVAMNNGVSQSVPHLHAHVVPRHKKDGLRGFFWPRVRYESATEAADFAARIAAAMNK